MEEFRDGIRTLSYKLVRDLGPEEVYPPPHFSGNSAIGYSGFKHLLDSGVIDEMPKLVAVQTEQVRPVCTSVRGEPYPQGLASIANALIPTNPPLHRR